MSTISFSRSRSPVMSIRTEPADENILRAEIEAASRTQHELLPQYSWYTAWMRKSDRRTFRKLLSPATNRNSPPSDWTKHYDLDDNNRELEDTVFVANNLSIATDNHLRRTRATRKPWKRLTRLSPELNESDDFIASSMTPPKQQRLKKQRKRGTKKVKHNDGTTAEEDSAARVAQFNAWLEEKVAERNATTTASQQSQVRAKRALRKSVYGSLSSTKSFLRNASQSPLERLRSRATFDIAVEPPHVYSFETKAQLHEYLEGATDVSPLKSHVNDFLDHTIDISPLSPLEKSFRIHDTISGTTPAELSATPAVRAELEGNTPSLTRTDPPRTSTPSVRELPPYIDDKRFLADIAKEQDLFLPYGEINESDSLSNFTVSTNDAHSSYKQDANSPSCQHDTTERFDASALSEALPPLQDSYETSKAITLEKTLKTHRPKVEQDDDQALRSVKVPPESVPESSMSTPSTSAKVPAVTNEATSVSAVTAPRHLEVESRLKDIHLDMVKEILDLRRETNLLFRERELVLRNREIEQQRVSHERELELRARDMDVRKQQMELRQREAVANQKSDALIRTLETITPYRDPVKSAFIGSQFQHCRYPHNPWMSQKGFDDSMFGLRLEKDSFHSEAHQKGGNVGLPTNSSATPDSTHVDLDLNDYGSNIKSCAAEKRKKEERNSTGLSGSTQRGSLSPNQSRKLVSPVDSEGDGNQDDEDENDGRSPKKLKPDSFTQTGPQVIFACPYSKYDPARYSSRNTTEKEYRRCATHYLTDVSRLKQHLSRVHWRPKYYCPRCYKDFKDSATLAGHAQAAVACPLSSDCPFKEKMDKTQQDKIHTKRPKVDPETVWFDIYKVLFPGSPLPESPYIEAEDRLITPASASSQSAVDAQATQMLSNLFNSRLNQNDEFRDNPLRPLLHQTLADSFAELLQSYSLSPIPLSSEAPSIMVSPVSSCSADVTRANNDSNMSLESPTLERTRSITNVVRQPLNVPWLHHEPPRPNRNSALYVPPARHCSSTSIRPVSSTNSNIANNVPTISIPLHIRDDSGPESDTLSYHPGDDEHAMIMIAQTTPPPLHRRPSVVTLDSGYGTGKTQRPLDESKVMDANRTDRSTVKIQTQETAARTCDVHAPSAQYIPDESLDYFTSQNFDSYERNDQSGFSNTLYPELMQPNVWEDMTFDDFHPEFQLNLDLIGE